MDGPSKSHEPGSRMGTNYTAYHFEDCKTTIVEYTKDFLEQNEVNGNKFGRGAVNAAFEANVCKVYAEGHPKREELLQQVRCLAISYFWKKRTNLTEFLRHMKGDETTRSGLSHLPDDIAKNTMYLLLKDGRKVEIPYLGLQSLDQVRYIDIAPKARVMNLGYRFHWKNVQQYTMSEIWKVIVDEIYWFEHSCQRIEKLAEKDSDEVRNYWKLLEYGDYIQSKQPTEHKISASNAKVPSSAKENAPSVSTSRQSRDLSIKRTLPSIRPTFISIQGTCAKKDLGYFPSIAAHASIQPPDVIRNNSELSRLRKLVGEYEVSNQDLSTRLIKAKKVEEQHIRELACYAEKFRLSDDSEEEVSDTGATCDARSEPNIHPAALVSDLQNLGPVDPTYQRMRPFERTEEFTPKTTYPQNQNSGCPPDKTDFYHQATDPLGFEKASPPQQSNQQGIQSLYQQKVQPLWYARKARPFNPLDAQEPNLQAMDQLPLGPSTRPAISAKPAQNQGPAYPTYQTTYPYDPNGTLLPQQRKSSHQQRIYYANPSRSRFREAQFPNMPEADDPNALHNRWHGRPSCHINEAQFPKIPESHNLDTISSQWHGYYDRKAYEATFYDPPSKHTPQPSGPASHTQYSPEEMLERSQPGGREFPTRQRQREHRQTGWENGPRWL